MYLRQEAKSDLEAAKLIDIIDSGLDDEAKLQTLLKALRDHPATERTYQEAKRWAAQAISALEELPKGPVREALTAFAEAVIERSN
jgi:heptaprenyl diphosphate synthase